MPTTLVMPRLGESVVEGTVSKWRVRAGDRVQKDQTICDVTTDKADVEVPSPVSGVVLAILVGEGATVPVGTALATLDGEGAAVAAPSGSESGSARGGAGTTSSRPDDQPAPAPPGGGRNDEFLRSRDAGQRGSPVVRRLAREHGIDLASLRGSGEGGRVTRADVEAAIAAPAAGPTPTPLAVSAAAPRSAGPAPIAAPPVATAGRYRVPPYVPRPGDQVVPFTRRRRLIADHMVQSKATSPHVATVAEVDLARVVELRTQKKEAFAAEGISLTYMPFLCAATARALREFPGLNARMLPDATVLLADVNLGIAVETDDGLVVPVVRHADTLGLRDLAKAIAELTERARARKLLPDDLAGGTFTVSNPGAQGNLYGMAIINQPQVGILRVGEIVKRPVVVAQGAEDRIVVRPMVYLCLSYDHRVVDGVLANRFLHRIRERLEAAQLE